MPIQASREQILGYVRRVFADPPVSGYVSLSVFVDQTASDAPGRKRRAWPVECVLVAAEKKGWQNELADRAAARATEAARASGVATFAPPPALFRLGEDGKLHASEAALAGYRVTVVDADKEPEKAEALAREHIGEPSLIVFSGGYWTPPDGGARERKRHLYYIHEWLTDPDAMAAGKRLRQLVSLVIGAAADPTANSPVHPMRWPGALNMKDPSRPVVAEMTGQGKVYSFAELYGRAEKACLDLGRDVARPAGKGSKPDYTPEDVAAHVNDVLAGTSLHNPLTSLSMTLLRRPLIPEEALALLRTLMEHSAAQGSRPADWQDRYEDLERTVTSAYAKLSFGATDEEQKEAVEEAVELAEKEEAGEPAVAPQPEEGAPPSQKVRLQTLTPERLETTPPPRPWLVRPVILRGAVTALSAAGGVGKTTFGMQLALGLAVGELERLLGPEFSCARPARTLVINNEEPTDELVRRAIAVCRHFELEPLTVGSRVKLWGSENPRFVVARKRSMQGVVERAAHAESLLGMIRKLKIDATIVDPMISTHEGLSENSNEDIEKLMAVYRDIAYQTQTAIIVVHHMRKVSSDGPANLERQAGDMYASRGAGSMGAAVRSMLTLAPANRKSLKGMGLEDGDADTAALSVVRLDNAKANYARRRGSTWYVFETVNLDNGADGWDGDEVGVLQPVTPKQIVARFSGGIPDMGFESPDAASLEPVGEQNEGGPPPPYRPEPKDAVEAAEPPSVEFRGKVLDILRNNRGWVSRSSLLRQLDMPAVDAAEGLDGMALEDLGISVAKGRNGRTRYRLKL